MSLNIELRDTQQYTEHRAEDFKPAAVLERPLRIAKGRTAATSAVSNPTDINAWLKQRLRTGLNSA